MCDDFRINFVQFYGFDAAECVYPLRRQTNICAMWILSTRTSALYLVHTCLHHRGPGMYCYIPVGARLLELVPGTWYALHMERIAPGVCIVFGFVPIQQHLLVRQ